MGEPLAGDPHLAMPTCSVTRNRSLPASLLVSPKIRREHRTKKFLIFLRPAPAPDPNSPLERALQRLGAGIEERLLLNGSGGTV